MDKDVVHIYSEYYSALRKDEIMPFSTTWMDLEIITLSDISQKEKEKYHDITHTYIYIYMESKT